jgi:hypothetical protein
MVLGYTLKAPRVFCLGDKLNNQESFMKLINLLLVCTFMLFASMADAGAKEKDRQIVAGPRADWQAVADAVALTGHETAAADIEAALSAMTDEELYLGYGQMDLTGLAEAFVNVAESFDALEEMYPEARDYLNSKNATNAVEKLNSGNQAPMSVGLPGATDYPTAPEPCPFSPDRSGADALLASVDAVAAANVALETARGVWSVADRSCGTVAVAIGAVGNPQNALCVATDTVLYTAQAVVTTAEGVRDHITFCDGTVNSAEIEGTYDRAGHIHTDLSNHDSDIKTILASGAGGENQQLIKIILSRQQEIMRLLITPTAKRVVNEDVLTCTGDDCPEYPALQLCPNGSLKWNCKN